MNPNDDYNESVIYISRNINFKVKLFFTLITQIIEIIFDKQKLEDHVAILKNQKNEFGDQIDNVMLAMEITWKQL